VVGTRVRVLKDPSVKATQLTVGTSIGGTITPPLLMTIAKALRLQRRVTVLEQEKGQQVTAGSLILRFLAIFQANLHSNDYELL